MPEKHKLSHEECLGNRRDHNSAPATLLPFKGTACNNPSASNLNAASTPIITTFFKDDVLTAGSGKTSKAGIQPAATDPSAEAARKVTAAPLSDLTAINESLMAAIEVQDPPGRVATEDIALPVTLLQSKVRMPEAANITTSQA